VGELEVQMPQWALALFFDLSWWGKPKYETLIQPPMLLRNAQIRPHRIDGIIRITARRQDAEDIATQLENKVLLMGKQQLVIDPLIQETYINVPAGRSLQYFKKEQLEIISQRTQSVFIQEKGGSIGIYSFKQPDRLNARRLLLSMLDLSSRNVKTVTLEPSQLIQGQPEESAPKPLALVPFFPGRGLHFRDRTKRLARLALPEKRRSGLTKPDDGRSATTPEMSLKDRAEGMSRALVPLIADFEPKEKERLTRSAREVSQSSTSHWAGRPFTASKTWWVHLGLILQESKPWMSGDLLAPVNTVRKSDESKQAVFLRQVPGYETLLSYFMPHRRQASQIVERSESNLDTPLDLVARKSTIVAHFTPSPFTRRGAKIVPLLPRLELTLLRRFGKGNEDGELKIESLRGVLEEHIIDVPLPDQAVDVRLSRKVASYANLPSVNTDPHIREFLSALNSSVKSGGSLHGTSVVEFKLPGWMEKPDLLSRQRQIGSLSEIRMPYLFDRFEQVQSTGFRKNKKALSSAKSNSALALFNENFPSSASLEYKEIEAGDIGGGYTDISFKVHGSGPKYGPKNFGEPPIAKSEEDKGPSMSTLLTHALSIADFVTRACRGEIRTWRGHSGLPRSDVVAWEGEGDDEPSGENARSDTETAKVVDEIESAETSDEIRIAGSATAESGEEDGIATSSGVISSSDNETAKPGEENVIAPVSEENPGANIGTTKVGDEDENVKANDVISDSNSEVGEEDSAAETHPRQ